MSGAPHSPAARLTVGALRDVGGQSCPHYIGLLDAAFVTTPPHFEQAWFGELFRHRGRDAGWLASLLASDSYMEGYSAKRLWHYAAQLPDPKLGRNMRRHAMDEARHSRIFARTLLKTFPELAGDTTLRADLERNAPSLTAERDPDDDWMPDGEEVLTSLILINLFEIKALVLGQMIKPLVLAHASDHNRSILRKMLDLVIRDEAFHISYSAAFLESACVGGQRDLVGDALQDFQKTLNQLMHTELEADSSFELRAQHCLESV